MDFAKKELEKYGWKEGDGLGKHKSGIRQAIKPKLKFDTGGLGHDVYEDVHNNWWQKLYDDAAKNLVTKTKNDCVVLETVENSVEVTTNKRNKKIKCGNGVTTSYDNFVKIAELTQTGEKRVLEEPEPEKKEKKKKKANSGICELTDEELFNVCGGRTAHKGARHGLQMSAKLARIQEQEQLFANPCSFPATGEKRKKKSKKKHVQKQT